jgi:delta-1-pyrroline-5-carboxylate synthetase
VKDSSGPHRYIDEAADLSMALQLVVDSKSDYPAACNAVEKVLLHAAWLSKGGLVAVREALEAAGVTVHAGRSVNLGLPCHARWSER